MSSVYSSLVAPRMLPLILGVRYGSYKCLINHWWKLGGLDLWSVVSLVIFQVGTFRPSGDVLKEKSCLFFLKKCFLFNLLFGLQLTGFRIRARQIIKLKNKDKITFGLQSKDKNINLPFCLYFNMYQFFLLAFFEVKLFFLSLSME